MANAGMDARGPLGAVNPARSATPARRAKSRIDELDALRGLAALAVMLFHHTTRIGELYPMGQAPLVEFRHGHLGVNLFFVISGYVIFMTLQATRKARDFVVSRASRLLPTYWAAIAITFSATHAIGLPGHLVSARDALANFVMVHGLFGVPHVDGVYWTLEVEMLFYAGILALYAAGLLARIHVVLWCLLAARVVAYLGEGWGIPLVPWTVQRLLILKHVPWFAIGIAVYLLQTRPQEERVRPLATIVASAAVLAAVDASPIALLSLAFAALVYGAATQHLRWLANPALVWLGGVSYPLYLVHENIGWSLQLRLRDAGVSRDAGILVTMAIALGLAALLSRFVEYPAMDWIRARWRKA